MILFLIGARGSGKTTVGRALAEKLGWKAVDLDEEIVRRERKSISEIVASAGWDKFRDLESEALRAVVGEDSHRVVSTGGGAILREENRAFMRENGVVVWLKASPRVLSDRLSANPMDEQRPALTDLALEEEIRDILRAREPLYAECAERVADAELEAEQICENIASLCDLRREDQ